ncbi:hypothetical protein EON64_03075 [archaeon]|nr:MAG: hypothetical protein EON64_03075 [archaeon]
MFATRDSSGKERFPLLQLLSNNLDTWNNAAPLSPLLFMVGFECNPFCCCCHCSFFYLNVLCFQTFLSQIIVQSSQEAASTLCAEFVRLLQSMLAKYSAALSQCFAREPSVHSVCSIFLEDGVTHNQLHGEDSSSSLVLRFLSHLLLRQIDAAGKLLIGVIVDAWSLLPLRGGSTRAGELGGEGRLLSLAAALQVLLNILNHAAAQSASIETDADSEAECLWRAAQQLVQQYQVLRYLGGLAVRLAALFLSLSSPQYAQVTYVLLSEESQVDYRAHAQHMEALCAQEQERSRRNSRVKVGSQAVDHEDDADDGFKYVLAASKEECDDYLCGKPVGTFVVRLSPSGAAAPLVTQQMYLCFRADPASEADQEKGALSSSIRHAVVRREEFGAGVVMYRCGSVGPFSSLAELLIEISNRLPSPLLFHHSPPSPSPAPGFSTVSAQLQCRDMNARLWKELEKLLPTLVVAFASSLHTKQEAGKTGAVSNAVLSTTLADDSDDESKATAVTEDEDSSNSPVGTADQARQPECATESMNMVSHQGIFVFCQFVNRLSIPLSIVASGASCAGFADVFSAERAAARSAAEGICA